VLPKQSLAGYLRRRFISNHRILEEGFSTGAVYTVDKIFDGIRSVTTRICKGLVLIPSQGNRPVPCSRCQGSGIGYCCDGEDYDAKCQLDANLGDLPISQEDGYVFVSSGCHREAGDVLETTL
jgi:hypothetical protein